MESGERFALMIDRATGMPDPHVCKYSATYHRHRSINSAERELDALCLFHEWLDERGIDLAERVMGGAYLYPDEVEALSNRLRSSKRPPRVLGNSIVPRIVSANTHQDRMNWAFAYTNWRAAPYIARAADPSQAINMRDRLTELKEQMKGLCACGTEKVREALTDEQRCFLLTVTRPDDPRNPFRPNTRHRNFALILMYDELGLRKGEPLTLKGEDVMLFGSHPRLIFVPRPDDPEETRAKPPLLKTAGRSLITSALLSKTLNDYAVNQRPKMRNSKKIPYYFLNTKDNGEALSLDGVDDIFRTLKNRFPEELPTDFSAHIVRHTWNSRFRRLAAERNWESPFRDTVNNFIMGWAKNSTQSKRYAHTEISREAEQILADLQSLGGLLS